MDKEEVDYKKETTPLLTKYPQQEDMERGEEAHRRLTKQEIALMLDALEDESEMRYHERMRKEGLPCYPAFRRSRAGKEEGEEDNTTTKVKRPLLSKCEILCVSIFWFIIVAAIYTLATGGFKPSPTEPNPCSPDAFKEVFGNKAGVNFLDIQLMHTNNDVLHVFATVDNYAQCKYIRQCLKLGTPLKTLFPVACRVDNSRPVLGMIDFPDTSMYEIYD